jgi:hypothetical protein
VRSGLFHRQSMQCIAGLSCKRELHTCFHLSFIGFDSTAVVLSMTIRTCCPLVSFMIAGSIGCCCVHHLQLRFLSDLDVL